MSDWPITLHVLFHLVFFVQPKVYNFRIYRLTSWWVASCISSMDVHIGIFTDVLMACTFMFMPMISLSLFSVQLFRDNQPTVYRCGPGLYTMDALYWSMCSMMCCKCWDSVETSLLIIAINVLCITVMWNFSQSCNIPRASHSILL